MPGIGLTVNNTGMIYQGVYIMDGRVSSEKLTKEKRAFNLQPRWRALG